MANSDEIKHLSGAEVEQRIGALTRADCVRLERLGRIYSWGTSWTAADLLQEAIVAALQVRQWRSDLDVTTFLVGAMRSIAYSKRKSARLSPLDRGISKFEDALPAILEAPSGENPQDALEEEQVAEALIARLTEMFSDDPEVQRLITARVAGDSPAEIKAALGMNQSQYETVCRRLLRGYQKRVNVERS